MQTQARLLVVDDQPLYLEGLRALLARAAPHLPFTAVRTPSAAMERLGTMDGPLLVIIDHRLAATALGAAFLEQLCNARPRALRALLSGIEDAGLCRQARRAGYRGYLTRRMDDAEWMDAVQVILAGGYYFAASAPAPAALNDRQLSVLQLASSGLGNREIAARLHLTERTVKYHLSETFVRLSTSSRTEAVAKAAALGLISLPDHQATHVW